MVSDLYLCMPCGPRGQRGLNDYSLVIQSKVSFYSNVDNI